MITRLIHLLMCLTVLLCPALGGTCCGIADGSVTDTDGCEDRCCCDSEHEEAPAAPDCPEPCHDCFCAGALPPGFGPLAEVTGALSVSAVAPAENLADATSSQRLEFASRDESPPHGRALLTSYCQLLL